MIPFMHRGQPWTDEELSVAVETYRFLLRLQNGGYSCSENELALVLMGGPLARRNQASIRYRMRNISAILADRGFPILKAFSSAPRAGAGVRTRLEAMLFSEDDTGTAGVASVPGDEPDSPEEVLAKAERALRAALAELEREHLNTPGIGHNKPPESIDRLRADDFRDAISTIEASRSELAAARLTAESAERRAQRLAGFGIRAAAWAGERLTKATDAALVTAARLGAVALLLAALPPLSRAIEVLIKLASG